MWQVLDFDAASEAWRRNKSREEEGDEWEYPRQVQPRSLSNVLFCRRSVFLMQRGDRVYIHRGEENIWLRYGKRLA